MSDLGDLFGFDEEPVEKEDVFAVIRSLTAAPCRDCPLGLLTPSNPGFLWRGNPNAAIAILGDMPSAADMSARKPFVGEQGLELAKWLRLAELKDADVFITSIVQCKTQIQHSKKADKDGEPRTPHRDQESGVCFPSRALRVLKALPNLEVVILLGLFAAKIVLGGDPQVKSHCGFWFGSDILPGKAIFVLQHPRDFDEKTGEEKRGRLKQMFKFFRIEYFGLTQGGVEIVAPKKVVKLLELLSERRKAARQF